MTTEAMKSFFALLESEEQDFATLIKRFGIDPAKDLQNCDLSNVDFGRLVADTVDVTGATLDGANLSQIRCKNLVGFDGVIPPAREKHFLEEVRVAVLRYQNSDWTLNQVLRQLSESTAPILAFYDTTAEQDVLTKRLCAHFTTAGSGVEPSPSLGGLLWFYTKASKAQRFRLNPATLETNFFELLRVGSISHDVGIYPFVSNQAAVERICRSVSPGSYDQMRTQFAKSLRRELVNQQRGGLTFDPGSVVVFSGFPPISKRLYQEIREAGNSRLKLIFLCSSILEPFYNEASGMLWRRVAVPAYSIGAPVVVRDDIKRLKKRIEVVTKGLVTMSDETDAWMARFVGKPLAGLKAELLTRLKVRIGAATELSQIVL